MVGLDAWVQQLRLVQRVRQEAKLMRLSGRVDRLEEDEKV